MPPKQSGQSSQLRSGSLVHLQPPFAALISRSAMKCSAYGRNRAESRRSPRASSPRRLQSPHRLARVRDIGLREASHRITQCQYLAVALAIRVLGLPHCSSTADLRPVFHATQFAVVANFERRVNRNASPIVGDCHAHDGVRVRRARKMSGMFQDEPPDRPLHVHEEGMHLVVVEC